MSEQPTTSNLSKSFEFHTREAELYKLWEEQKCFKPESAADSNAPVFNISMPPPNANGELHLGHTFGYTVMDILGRFHRLTGKRTLLVPGKDHAGIQTQVVFEKKLKAEKVDLSQKSTSELYDACYAFCIDRAQYMRKQEKTIGISADWERELFTLDPRLNKIVFDTFVSMWRDGLVYKGHRIVNWSVFSQTSISDVEVEYVEKDGNLWYISYELVGGPKAGAKLKLPNGAEVTIGAPGLVTATTRPETMLGDTALAVNPKDPRYKDYVGKEVIVPLIGRKIKVIADARIDMTYGTGVVKVTPAHDFTDYDIGTTHKLEQIQVVGKDGLMTEAAGKDFVGKKSSEARELVIQMLTDRGQLLDTVAMKHKVPIGERGKDVIEPLISEQWFIAVDKPELSLKKRALELIRSGKIAVHPERFRVLFEQWLENLHDWNISRQLWWGHRLPVWYRGSETYVGVEAPTGDGWTQDTDVFDTWFSSGQWAYSTVAALDLLDLKKGKSEYFPNHTMVMGRDILLFWACRMLLMTAYRLNSAPWNNIFFTGLVRDEHGQKMSKSKGNGIEPGVILGKYGADAMRLAFVMGATPGNDIAFAERKVEGYSKFINKLWNAAKLIEMKCAGQTVTSTKPFTLETTRWMSSELGKLHEHVTDFLNRYEISLAANELYDFAWGTYCDWYLEFFKIIADTGTDAEKLEVRSHAVNSFRTLLTLLHPFIPFVTEELYQKLPFLKQEKALALSPWKNHAPTTSPAVMTKVQGFTNAIRSVKAAINEANKPIRVVLPEGLTAECRSLISGVARAEIVAASAIPEANALRKSVLGSILILEVADKQLYRSRLEKDFAQAKFTIESVEKKLAGDFGKNAKAEVIAQEKERLEQAKKAVVQIQEDLQGV